MVATCDAVLRSGGQCGVAAVGRCVQCEGAFSGSHQSFNNLRVPVVNLCLACSQPKSRPPEPEYINALIEKGRGGGELLSILSAAKDPVEKLLRALWLFSHHTGPRGFGTIRGNDRQIVCDADALREHLPEVWSASDRVSLARDVPWDSKKVADWFKRHASRAPQDSLMVEVSGLLRTRNERRSGWSFSSGSTMRVRKGDVTDFLHAAVLLDGSLLFGTSLAPREPGEGLNGYALRQMATLCGLGAEPQRAATVPKPSGERPYDEFALQRMISNQVAQDDTSPLLSTSWEVAS